MKKAIGAVMVVLSLAVLGGCREKPEETGEAGGGSEAGGAGEILKSYRTDFVKLTPEPHPVNGFLFMLCRRLSDKEILEIRDKQTGPHFLTLVDIYADEAGAAALTSGVLPTPVGTVIVKEKSKGQAFYLSNGQIEGTEGVGGMIKREPGYDSENGDWEYFYSDKDGKVTSGKMENCIECHRKAAETDYVFGTWLVKPIQEGEKSEANRSPEQTETS